MVMSLTPIVCITLAFWLGRSGLIASVGCWANAWPAHPAPNRITRWKSESRLVQIMVVLLGCRISRALCNAAARSSKQGGEVSTGSGSDRVIANRAFGSANAANPVAERPGTDLTPTLVYIFPA